MITQEGGKMNFKESLIIVIVTALCAYSLGVYIGWGKGCPDAPVAVEMESDLFWANHWLDDQADSIETLNAVLDSIKESR